MTQEKDERSGASARKTSAAGEDATKEAGKRPPGAQGPRDSANGKSVPLGPATRRGQYLIGTRAEPGTTAQAAGVQRQSMDVVVDYLSRQENIQIVKRLKTGSPQPFAANGGSAGEVVVARIEESKAERLKATAQPQIIIERDAFLSYADSLASPLHLSAGGAMLPLRTVGTEIAVRVIGEHEQPVAKATVLVYGPEIPAQAVTDETGIARLTLFGGTRESIGAICVKPVSNYWDRVVPAPRLNESGLTTIRLRPLDETFSHFPSERLVGWGQRLMRLDQGGGAFTGSGVKLGIIDSGCDSSHPQLRHITRGKDFIDRSNESNWTEDVISHGTHCVGIMNAANTGAGILGFVPDAEVHVFKVLPGGRVSDLLAALDECIARELDVVNISVGSEEFSELVSHKLHEARRKGIACVVAAGNSGGAVRFPAQLPTVLAVGAVGKIREFPPDSSHAYSVTPQLIGTEGIFPARFSCYGPQVAVSAPGVAVISTVPGGGYAAADGTSVAAAHVSGLATLILAHHPLFQGQLKARSEQRVDALFGLIRASAVLHFPDLLRGGAGVPDLARVPGDLAIPPVMSSGTEPFAPFLSPLAAQGWHSLMQMRAAGIL